MVRDHLRLLERAAVFEVLGDAGRPERVAAGGVGERGRKRPPLDHPQHVDARQWFCGDAPLPIDASKQWALLLESRKPLLAASGVNDGEAWR